MGVENTALVVLLSWAEISGGQAHSPAARTFRNPLQGHWVTSIKKKKTRDTSGVRKEGKTFLYKIEIVLLLTPRAVTLEKITQS